MPRLFHHECQHLARYQIRNQLTLLLLHHAQQLLQYYLDLSNSLRSRVVCHCLSDAAQLMAHPTHTRRLSNRNQFGLQAVSFDFHPQKESLNFEIMLNSSIRHLQESQVSPRFLLRLLRQFHSFVLLGLNLFL